MASGVEISRAVGKAPQAVYQWETIPVNHVLAVSALVGWRVTPHDLLPEIYPNPTDGLPPEIAACVAKGNWPPVSESSQEAA